MKVLALRPMLMVVMFVGHSGQQEFLFTHILAASRRLQSPYELY